MLVVPVLVAGCAQSYQPFYTEKSKSPVPELVGEWTALKALDDDLTNTTVKPWVCRETAAATYDVLTHGSNNVPALVRVVTFKVAGQLYCDVTAGDVDKIGPVNPYWVTSVTAVHTVWKLQLTNDLVTLTALDAEWLKRTVDSKDAVLPFIPGEKDDLRLYTATPQQWEQFLARFGAGTNAFGGDPWYILKRRASPK